MFWTPVGLTYILAPLDNLIFFSFKNKVKKYHRRHGLENDGNYSMNNQQIIEMIWNSWNAVTKGTVIESWDNCYFRKMGR